jgi:hypothetical protein
MSKQLLLRKLRQLRPGSGKEGSRAALEVFADSEAAGAHLAVGGGASV